MKNRILYIFSIMLMGHWGLLAQTFSPNVQPATGSYGTVGNMQLQYTIGEPLILTLRTSANEFSLGFEQPEMNIVSSISAGSYCGGSPISISFTVKGIFGPGNFFTAQLSDSSGNFGDALILKSDTTVHSDTIRTNVPDYLLCSSHYRVRVVSSYPVIVSAPSSFITIHAIRDSLIPTQQDTIVCMGSSSHIYVPTSQTGIKYLLVVNTAVIDSAYGNDSTLTFNTGAIDRNTTFYVLAADTATGCSSQLAPYLTIYIYKIAAPTPPAPKAVNSTTAYTFNFVNIKPGFNGNELEWALDSNFTTGYYLTCFDTVINGKDTSSCSISFTVSPNSDTMFWLRSIDTVSGCMSTASASIAIVTHIYQVDTLNLDTIIYVCAGSSTNIPILHSHDSLLYTMRVDTGIIASTMGNDSTLYLSTGTVNSSTIFYITVKDIANGDTAALGYGVLIQAFAPVDSNAFLYGDTFVYVYDTICYNAIANNGIRAVYSISSGSAYIDSLTGCVSSISSNYTVYATIYGPTGCGSVSASLPVNITTIAPPTPPASTTAYIDSPTENATLTFNITAGSGGNAIELAFNKNFTGSTLYTSPATVNITFTGVQDTVLYLRSVEARSGSYSSTVKSLAATALPTISAGLLDKTNWQLQANVSDEFNYAADDPLHPATLYPDEAYITQSTDFFNKWSLVFNWGGTPDYLGCGDYVAGFDQSTICLCDWGNCPLNPPPSEGGTGTCGLTPGSGHEVWFTDEDGMGIAHFMAKRLPNPVSVNEVPPSCPNSHSVTGFTPVTIYYQCGNISSLGHNMPLINSMWEMRCRFPQDESEPPGILNFGMWAFSGSAALNMMDVECTSTKVNSTIQDGAYCVQDAPPHQNECTDVVYNGIDCGECGINTFKQTPCDYDEGWHTITAVSTATEIIYFVDGKESWSTNVANSTTYDNNISNGYWPTEFSSSAGTKYMTINIGINAAHSCATCTDIPQWDYAELQVDYFRYYTPINTNNTVSFQNINGSYGGENWALNNNITGGGLPFIGAPVTLEYLYNNEIPYANTPLNNNGNLPIINNPGIGIAPTSIAYSNQAGLQKIYFQGIDGRLYNAYKQAGSWYEYPLDGTTADANGGISVSEPRVYYRNNQNEIEYFQWANVNGQDRWVKFSTGATCLYNNDASLLNVNLPVDQLGRVWYIDNSNNVCVWTPTSAITGQSSTVISGGSASYNLNVWNCGCLMFYADVNGNLVQQSWWNGWSSQGEVASNVSFAAVKDEQNGRLFYINNAESTTGDIYAYSIDYSQPSPAGAQKLGSTCEAYDNAFPYDNDVYYTNQTTLGEGSVLGLSPDANIVYYLANDNNIWYYWNDKDHGITEDDSIINPTWYRTPITQNSGAGIFTVQPQTGQLFYADINGVLNTIDWENANNVISCPNLPHNSGNDNAALRIDTVQNADSSATSGVIDSLTFSINVYPNPSASTFTFIINKTAQPVEINIVISNLDGQIVATLQKQLQSGGRQTLIWDAMAIGPGIYYYKGIFGNGSTANGKLVKM